LQGGWRNSGAIAKPRFVGELGLTDAEEDALSASFHQCCASIWLGMEGNQLPVH
jgi:hypothetical protein